MESIFFVPLVSVFVKPDDQSQTCLSYGMARKGAQNVSVFVKPDDQSQTCLSYGMARKGALKMNVFRFRVYIFMRAALKKSEE